MTDEQPLQAHLRDKPAKEPSAKESGTAQCQTSWHPAVELLERQGRRKKGIIELDYGI